MTKKKHNTSGWRPRLSRLRWPKWLAPYRRPILISLGVTVVLVLGGVSYLYVSYGRIIDARLHGERDRAVPRVFGRPITLQTGQNITQAELVARLNDVGYAQKTRVEAAGEFAINPGFDRVRDAHAMQRAIGGDHVGADPGAVLRWPWLCTPLHDRFETRVRTHFVLAVAQHFAQ